VAKGLTYRAIGPSGIIVPTPLYGGEELLAEIVLGEEAHHWREVRRVFERQGMKPPRAAVRGLYYIPAVLSFLNRREGLAAFDEDYPDDGPDNFGP
jgi:hypothetical protein